MQVASADRDGIMLAGDQPWLLDLAAALMSRDVPVLLVLVDGDREEAVARGLLTYQGSLDGPELHEAMDAVGVGTAVVAAKPEAGRSYLVEHLSEVLGRRNVFVVRLGDGGARHLYTRAWGRRAFRGELDDLGDRSQDLQIGVVEGVTCLDRRGGPVPLFYLFDDQPTEIAGSPRRGRGAREAVVAHAGSDDPARGADR